MTFFTRFSILFIPAIYLLSTACGPSVPPKSPSSIAVRTKTFPNIPKSTDDGLSFLSEFSPYFDAVSGGKAAQLLAEDRLQDALVKFDEIILSSDDPKTVCRARFLVGYIAERIGDDARAVKELTSVAPLLPLISDLAWQRAARAAYRLGRYRDAADYAKNVDVKSVFYSDAAMTGADALRSSGNYTEAESAYRAYIDQFKDGAGRDEARSRLVECAANSPVNSVDYVDKLKVGLSILQQLQSESPSAYWTRQAEAFEEILMKGLGLPIPADRPARRIALDAYQKALDLKNKMKNEAAEREYNNVIRLAKKSPSLLCLARFEQAITVQQQRDFERAAGLYEGTAADCEDPSIRARSLYRGAKAYESAGKLDDAIRLYQEVENEFPEHSFADDAAIKAAQCYLRLGDKEKFREILIALPTQYPAGDMRAEALWIMALDAVTEGELITAKDALTAYYTLFPKETGWYAAGRSGYWLARVEERLGDMSAAAIHYEHAITIAPFSFYMVSAYNRLEAMDAPRARRLMEALAPKGDAPELKFRRALLTEYPAFAKTVELYRLGLISCAERAFRPLLHSPYTPAELHWIAAALSRRAGRYAESRETASDENSGWEERYPVNEDLLPWTLAYPTVFEETVQNAADASSVSPNLIWAIMREESGFNPKIESWANALGLMQLILPTAKAMGKELGITVTRGNLRKPEVNIALGAQYLSHLSGLFGGHPVLVAAGYNAGEGAVAKWLKNRTDKDVDLFVEEIPYDQTRGYTKRVIGTLAAYTYLYSDKPEMLALPLTFP
jgi:soluble lytic murein transglycosylase